MSPPTDPASPEQSTHREVVVALASLAVSSKPEEVLVTHSLGSSMGLALYDPEAGVGGLLHCLLPLSKLEESKMLANPAVFADTGTVKLLNDLLAMGARKGRLVAKLAGASALRDDTQLFRMGERTYAVIHRVLAKNDIAVAGEDCGGCRSRALRLYMASGRTTVKTRGVERDL